MAPARTLQVDDLITNAGDVAAAAMRELPEALIVGFDQELRFVLAAGQALKRLGNPPACREGQPVADAFPAEVWKPIEPLFRSALAGEIRSREVWTSAQRYCLMVDVGPLRVGASAEGEEGTVVAGGLAVILDITARRRADELTPRPYGDFAEVFDRAPMGTGLLDLDGRWLLVNRALCEITGYTLDELIGKRFDGIMHPDDAYNDAEQRQRLLAGELSAYQIEKRYFDAAGETVSAMLSVSLVRDPEGAPLQLIAQLQDISERKQLEEHLRHLADHDPLTGLRNRRLFEHDLKLQVARSQRYGEQAALMVIDLDDFRRVNDEHGHAVGDETLRAVARSLSRRLRQTDLIARLGGDEFAVLLPHAGGEAAAVVADGLGRVIRACGVDAGDDVLHPAASIGFALIDHSCESAEQVLVEAQRAMYAAKRGQADETA
ncbi:MAG TPA: diguanylate cyclase [Solirubrobacteraceae bacterium]|nr:diguanylate cyclase [Solirubrobacteraceae bacterium]